VLLITDPSSGVQAMIQRSREVGVVNGRAGELPVMDYISQGGDVTPGDVVITSGLGGNFPEEPGHRAGGGGAARKTMRCSSKECCARR